MVISTRIIAIGTKKATFFISGKRDTEIIAGRVDRRLHILDIPLARAVQGCFENIQPTHSRMSIGSKIKRYGIPHIRKHLITRRINIRPQIFHRSEVTAHDTRPKQVFASITTYGIRHKIQILAVRRYRRVAESRHRIFYDIRPGSFSPFGTAAGRYIDFRSTRPFRILCAIGVIHRIPVFGKRRRSLVKLGVHLVFEFDRSQPSSILVLLYQK